MVTPNMFRLSRLIGHPASVFTGCLQRVRSEWMGRISPRAWLSVRRTARQRGNDRALRDYGIESCRLHTESANKLLTGDPETVDTIKYMETVCD